MKKYCEYYIKQYESDDVSRYIFRTGTPGEYNAFNELEFAGILYRFLNIVSKDDIKELNYWMTAHFGRVRVRKSVTEKMYGFVKYLRQGDTFRGENAGHKDMLLHGILNSTEFLEEFIFRFNNK
jgi:hypothetical protein